MTFLLIFSLVMSLAVVAASLVFIRRRLPPKQNGELLRLSETRATAILGAMLVALALFLPAAKLFNPAIAGQDLGSYWFVAGFSVLCALCDGGVFLYTFLKNVIICEDRLIAVSLFGGQHELAWKAVREVRTSMLARGVTLIGGAEPVKVGGEPKGYRQFLQIAKNKVKRADGIEKFDQQLERFLF